MQSIGLKPGLLEERTGKCTQLLAQQAEEKKEKESGGVYHMASRPKKLKQEATENELPPEQRLCTSEACAIQYCLNRFNHQEKYCKAFIDEWKRCRDKVRDAAGWESN